MLKCQIKPKTQKVQGVISTLKHLDLICPDFIGMDSDIWVCLEFEFRIWDFKILDDVRTLPSLPLFGFPGFILEALPAHHPVNVLLAGFNTRLVHRVDII